MLENLYTTQMSNDKEKLKTRLENIQCPPKKKHTAMGLLVFLVLAAALTVGTLCLAATTTEDTTMTDEEFAAYLDQPWGADIASLDYADEEILVFHYNEGLFVLDLENFSFRFVFDLSGLNLTTAAQGDVFLQVDVALDGSAAYLFVGGATDLAAEYDSYVIDLTTGQVKKGEIPEGTDLFRSHRDISTVIPEAAGWYDWRCIVDSQTYYLNNGGSTVRDLQLVTHYSDGSPDNVWYLFGEPDTVSSKVSEDLSALTADYMDSEFHRVYDPYYDIQDLSLSAWKQNGNEATFYYTMTYLRYNRDPDKVAYIRDAKDGDQEIYESLCKDYLALQESNYSFKIIWNGETPELYSEVSVKGPSTWHGPITVDDFIVS